MNWLVSEKEGVWHLVHITLRLGLARRHHEWIQIHQRHFRKTLSVFGEVTFSTLPEVTKTAAQQTFDATKIKFT